MRLTEEQYRALTKKPEPKKKYKNTRTETEDGVFDSKKEAHRYTELNLALRNGWIVYLARQVKFRLGDDISYVADFVYNTAQGEFVVEDVKGVRTQVYLMKKKLMRERFGVEILET